MIKALLIVGGITAVVAVPALIALAVFGGGSGDAAACMPGQVDEIAELDREQTQNAGVIAAAGRAASVPEFGLQIALATAMQESRLRNLPYGDRDSQGMFQQRPSTGWGTPAQVTDPAYAAEAFFGGTDGPNNGEPPGLLDINGWQTMPLATAAQAVQRSAFPHAYAQWEDAAASWVRDLLRGNTAAGACLPGGGLVCPQTSLAVENGLTANAVQVLRCIASHFPQVTTFVGVGDRPNESDHPAGRAVDVMIPDWGTPSGNELGWRIAEWVRSNHACLGVSYVIWDAMIWSAARSDDGWRPYQHPNGWTDANSLHRNHVHVSVKGDGFGSCADGPWMVPVSGSYTVTAHFGDTGELWSRQHTGVDLSAPLSRPVLAASTGQVTDAGWDGPYGQKVEITHADGTRTWYAHLSTISVQAGSSVAAGDQVGLIGSSGNATGPHLHFEVHPYLQGAPVDPEPWMAARGASI